METGQVRGDSGERGHVRRSWGWVLIPIRRERDADAAVVGIQIVAPRGSYAKGLVLGWVLGEWWNP